MATMTTVEILKNVAPKVRGVDFTWSQFVTFTESCQEIPNAVRQAAYTVSWAMATGRGTGLEFNLLRKMTRVQMFEFAIKVADRAEGESVNDLLSAVRAEVFLRWSAPRYRFT